MKHPKSLLSVEQAIRRLTADLEQLPVEEVSLHESLGRVLAQEVRAPHPLPPFAHSAMDGYAVRAEDVVAASEAQPVELEVVGEAAAGQMPAADVGAGQAARITTGAPIPVGADSVVPVEFTDRPEPMGGAELASSVLVLDTVDRGDFIRPAGLDVAAGERLLPSGHRLRPQDLGLLGAIGLDRPRVRRRPKVALLSTGDEVIDVASELKPGLIRDANGVMMAAVLEAQGAVPLRLGIAGDSRQSVRQHLDRAVDLGADLILSTAGVSMGAHDYVRLVVEDGGQLSFWRVNVRPGKPLAFGSYRQIPFVGLPGNPVSAWVTAMLFVRPVLAAMLGASRPEARIVQARLQHPIESDGRQSYLRSIIEFKENGYQVQLTGSQDSAVISSLVKANGLLIVPAGVEQLAAGEQVEVWLMGDDGLMEACGYCD